MSDPVFCIDCCNQNFLERDWVINPVVPARFRIARRCLASRATPFFVFALEGGSRASYIHAAWLYNVIHWSMIVSKFGDLHDLGVGI